jgi:hypothetical protein
MNHLLTCLRRVRTRHSRPIPRFRGVAPAIRSVVGSAEQLTAAVSSLIGLPQDAASTVASRIIAAEADLVTELGRRRGGAGRLGAGRLRAGALGAGSSGAGTSGAGTLRAEAPRLSAPSARRIDLGPLLALEQNARPYVLALPFTVETVTLLEELSRRTHRILRVEKTPLLEPILRVVAERMPDRMELNSPRELIRHNLSPRVPAARGTTYVTFPDHHWTGEETSRRVRFFGEDHWFALLESLLLIRGASPVLTLAPGDDACGGGLVWVEYGRGSTKRPVTEDAVLEPLAWLASCLESTMRASPSSVLSWITVAARSVRARASWNLLDRNLTAGFIRAWRATDPIVHRRLLAGFLDRLEREEPEAIALPQEAGR